MAHTVQQHKVILNLNETTQKNQLSYQMRIKLPSVCLIKDRKKTTYVSLSLNFVSVDVNDHVVFSQGNGVLGGRGGPPIRPQHHMNTFHADVGYRTPVTAVKGENNRQTEILVRGIRVSTKSASTSLYIKERFV